MEDKQDLAKLKDVKIMNKDLANLKDYFNQNPLIDFNSEQKKELF